MDTAVACSAALIAPGNLATLAAILVRIFMGCDLGRKRKRKKCIVIPGDGDPCPRCGNPMQIREYADLNEKQERRPFFYTRWFCCMNKACKTTLVMPARYKVVTNDTSRTDEAA